MKERCTYDPKLNYIKVTCVLKPTQRIAGENMWEVTFKGETMKCANPSFIFYVNGKMCSLNGIHDFINVDEVLNINIENTNEVSVPIGFLIPKNSEFCQKELEDTANYYKGIMKTSIPELTHLLSTITALNNKNMGYILNTKNLEAIIHRFKSESYGV